MLKFLLMLCVPWILGASATTCPWTPSGLTSFQASFPKLTQATNAIITSQMKLDVANVDVQRIEIQGNGALIFDDIDITIRAKEILIKDNGALIIGDENCRYEKNAIITLHGARTTDRTQVNECGEKDICVTGNGTLKMYGKDIPSWTKITATANMPTYDYRHRTDAAVNDIQLSDEGLSLTILNGNDLTRNSYNMYDIWKEDDASGEQAQVTALINKLSAVQTDEVVSLVVQNFFASETGVDFSSLYDEIETVSGIANGALLLRNAKKYDAFALVFKKVAAGQTKVFDQELDSATGKHLTHARANITENSKAIVAVSNIDSGSKTRSFVDVQVFPQSEAEPTLTLAEDVDGLWQEDDKVVIASSDYSWLHNEVREIGSVGTNQVTLKTALDYRHFGQVENAVDMRAEIGLLTRNIKIKGEMADNCPTVNGNCALYNYDTYGAHIKVNQSFYGVHIEGVEISEAGQVTDQGFYPIHFHLCGYVGEKEAIIKRTSIHNSFRAIALHGIFGKDESSPGVQVIDNVAYNILGHAMFLESGAEKATLMEKNLVMQVRKAKGESHFFKSDVDRPASYFISTPETKMVDNVGTGSEGLGIWHTYPARPVGVFPPTPIPQDIFQPIPFIRTIKDIYFEGEAFRTKLFTFDNNVLHSNAIGGLSLANIILKPNGEYGEVLPYDPRVDPLNPTSAYNPATIMRVTAYKNREFNAYCENGGITFLHSSFAESKRLLQFAGDLEQSQYVWNSVFVGKSENNNESITNFLDPYGEPGKDGFDSYQGIVIAAGPVYVANSSFKGFKSESDIVAGAISPAKNNEFASSPVSEFKNIVFEGKDDTDATKLEVNRVLFGHPTYNTNDGFTEYRDGNEAATFIDLDGSIVLCDGQTFDGPYQVFPLENFAKTDNTKYRSNWQAAFSNEAYGKISLNIEDIGEDFFPANQAMRLNINDKTKAYEDNDGKNGEEFLTVLGQTNKYVYDMQFTFGFPKKVRLDAQVSGRPNDVVAGLCLPEGTTLNDIRIRITTSNRTVFDNFELGGIEEINQYPTFAENPLLNRVYLKDRMLYVLFKDDLERDPRWDQFDDKDCPGGQCPVVEITLDNQPDPSSYTTCFDIPKGQENVDLSPGTTESCVMSAKTRDPSWGAGNTLAARDGAWRRWSSWSDCCISVSGQQTSIRTRACDFPTPYGSGSVCVGEKTEIRECTVGRWTPWQDGLCICDGISTGVMTRTRSCIVDNGGQYCEGSAVEKLSCNAYCPAS